MDTKKQRKAITNHTAKNNEKYKETLTKQHKPKKMTTKELKKREKQKTSTTTRNDGTNKK